MSRTPLHDAAERGDVEEVVRLVGEGADKEAKERWEGTTPLNIAADEGHLEVVQFLLDRGADTEAATTNGTTPLNSAAWKGHLEVVQALLDRGADKEAADNDGRTPLYIAAKKGHLKVVQALLDRGANKDAANENGWTPLNVAADEGHVEVVQALLDRGANKEAANKDGWTPIFSAAYHGQLEVVLALLDRGANKEATIKDGWTPLSIAAQNGHQQVVQALLDRGANEEALKQLDWTPLHISACRGDLKGVNHQLSHEISMEAAEKFGWTPLHVAVSNGHLEVVQALLDRGANMEAASNFGLTPLNVAAWYGHLEVVRALLDRGANKDAANNDGWTPLNVAAWYGHLEVVRALLDRGTNKDAATNDGQTPLYIAAGKGHLEVVQALLDRGANREAANKYGWTPLIIAALNGHLEVVQALLDRGADKEAANNFGWTPLNSAAEKGHLKVVQALLDRGANKDAANNDGWTPLNVAAWYGHLEVVRALLDRGANKEAASNDGWTPLNSASQNGHLEVVQALLDRGANKEAANKYGWMPLISALYGHLEVVRALLDRGANKEAASNDGWTPLNSASQNGHLEVVQALLDRGANKEAATSNGRTPLISAAEKGHLEVVQALLDRGANKEAASNDGTTPLYIAAANGHLEVVKALLRRRARLSAKLVALPSSKQTGQVTLLHDFVRNGSDEMLLLALKSMGEDIVDDSGQMAVGPISSEAVQLLLAPDGAGRRTIDDLDKRLRRTTEDSPLAALRNSSLKPLVDRIPISPPRLHLCGPGGAGKTHLRHMLMGEEGKAQKLKDAEFIPGRTRGVEIVRCILFNGNIPGFRSWQEVQLFDHGGQKDFQFTYMDLLGKPLSVFVLVLPVNPEGHPRSTTPGGTTPASTERQLRYWLSLLETVAHSPSNKVIVVMNVFEGTSDASREAYVARIQAAMSEYVRSSMKQSNTEEATTEGDNEDMTTGRLNLASSVPICLSATSRSQTLQLFDLIRDSAAALGSAEEYCGSPDFGTDDLKMPAICSDVVRAIQQFRGEYRIQRAPDARRLLRKQVPELSNLNDLAVDALLSYAQQCGEILVHQDATPNADSADATTSGVVVWDPNWFSSSVLGYFFQPEDWSEEIGAGRSHCMEHNDVKAHLLVCLHRAGEPFHDGQEATDKMLETLVSMIHGMQLCVPIPGREQDWFPAFLHNSNIEDFEREILALGLKAPYDGVKAHFEDLTDGEVQDGICCGRLVSLRSASRFSTPSWHLFPRGTFARFQVKVLEAFPDPMLDSWSRDQSMHSNLGRPFIDRNVVKVVWEGDSKDDRAMCICQMLYDERTRLEIAWIAWIWTASSDAAQHLLATSSSSSSDAAAASPLLVQVATQLQAWFTSAAAVSGRTPDMFPYRLHRRAFLKAAGSILREPKNILPKSWKDWDSQPSEWERRKERVEDCDYTEQIASLREQVEVQNNAGERGEILAALRRLEAKQEEQGANIKGLLKYSQQTFTGYHHVPCTPLILPASIARELRAVFEGRDPSRWRRLARFLTDRTRILKEKKYLYFWCPVTGRIAETNDGRGYELEVPREWVTKYAKLVQVLRVLLDISLLVVGAVTGGGRLLSNIVEIVKTPDLPPEFDYLREYISENNEALERMNDQLIEQSEAGTSADEVKATDACSPVPVSSTAHSETCPRVREPLIVVGEHYGALVKILSELGVLTSAGRVFQCDATQAALETDVLRSLSQVAQRSFMAQDFSGCPRRTGALCGFTKMLPRNTGNTALNACYHKCKSSCLRQTKSSN
eukprot:scaffold7044_cov216-Pinguiococcus_pyrenoidosus.AAC.15